MGQVMEGIEFWAARFRLWYIGMQLKILQVWDKYSDG